MEAEETETARAAAQRPPLRGLQGFAENHFAGLSLIIGLFCGALIFHATRGGSFRDDDVMLIGQGQDYGFSVRSLFGNPDVLEHLVPVSNALSWAVGTFGAHWWMVHWYAAATTVLLVVLMAWLLRRITQSPLGSLLVAGAVGSSIVIFSIASWWTATALQLGMLCAGAAMLIFSLRWIESRSRGALVGAVLSQLLACGLYDRAQLLPLLAWALVAVARPPNEPMTLHSFWRRSRQAAPLLAWLFAVVVAQFVLTLVFGIQNSEGLAFAARTSFSSWGQVVADWWVVGAGSVASNGFAGTGLSASDALLHPRALSGIAVLVVIAFATTRNRRAKLTWAALIALVTLSGLQVAAGRLGQLGPLGLAANHRYQELTLFFLAVLIPAAWVASGRPWPRSRSLNLLLAGLIVLAASFWLISLRNLVQNEAPFLNRATPYAERFGASLRAWSESGSRVTLLDDRVPDEVVFRVPTTADYSLTSKIARIYANGVKVPPVNQLDEPAIRIDPTGVFREVRFSPEETVRTVGSSCGRATATAVWLGPGAVGFAGAVPASVRQSGRAIALSVRLQSSNARGKLAITSLGELPLLVVDLADYPDGLRMIIPAGTREIAAELWRGASACKQRISVSSILSP